MRKENYELASLLVRLLELELDDSLHVVGLLSSSSSLSFTTAVTILQQPVHSKSKKYNVVPQYQYLYLPFNSTSNSLPLAILDPHMPHGSHVCIIHAYSFTPQMVTS